VYLRVLRPIRTVAPRLRLPAATRRPTNERQAFPSQIETMKNKSTIAILAALLLAGSFAFADSAVPKDYPLKKCVVSDEKLGEHGKSVKVTAPDGTDVYLCCKDCLKDFKKDPAKYARMVKDAKK
jgi:hypothetical protein